MDLSDPATEETSCPLVQISNRGQVLVGFVWVHSPPNPISYDLEEGPARSMQSHGSQDPQQVSCGSGGAAPTDRESLSTEQVPQKEPDIPQRPDVQ